MHPLLWMIAAVQAQDPGSGAVELPLSAYRDLLDAVQGQAQRPPPPVATLQLDRSLEGAFRKGVFTGTLVTRFVVLPGREDERVPLLDAAVSVARVELDGRATSLIEQGGQYTVAVDRPGEHTARIEFFQGAEDDRFARNLRLSLPPAGPTRLSLWVPEADIEPTLAQGGLLGQSEEAGGTRILGQLDARGQLDLAWKGHKASEAGDLRLSMRADAIFTLHEAVLRGEAAYSAEILAGETDVLRLTLPPEVEIVDVTGPAVLQWATEPGALVVLLRYLADEAVGFKVSYQLPVTEGAPVVLRLPLPPEGVPVEGALGVRGPAGVHAAVRSAVHATQSEDLPPQLAALTDDPLLLTFDFSAAPEISLDVGRAAAVELSDTVIDSLEAATQLVEDGTEITKLQLRVRNNTRQYLALTLPPGAVLTSAKVDGRPLRPAVEASDAQTLLFPLLLSERSSSSVRYEVQAGDTLDQIADRFYGDPSLWGALYEQNAQQLQGSAQLVVGSALLVPARPGQATAERSFALDLVIQRRDGAMGWVGRRPLALPTIDAPVNEANWHVYLPGHLYPVDLSSNLSAWSHIRYDHLRRVRTFFDDAFIFRQAWAGVDGYSSILSRRKAIYRAENLMRSGGQEATSATTLVGERMRLRRLFLGEEPATATLTWVDRELLAPLRYLAMGLAFVLGRRVLSRERLRAALPEVAAGLGLLMAAWFFLGIHRRVVWGLDLALAVALLERHGPALRAAVRWPSLGDLQDLLRPRSLPLGGGLLLLLWTVNSLPRLWSILAFVLLSLLWRRGSRS